jgi:hypothetical protein
MHRKTHRREKDGKDHRSVSVVENRRLRTGKIAQRRVLDLGEIHDSQQAAGRKTREVFDASEQRFAEWSLFPEDRELPSDAVNSIQIQLEPVELRRPRTWGNGWLGCELWRLLRLDEFGSGRLPVGRETVAWEKVLELLVVNRLIDPGSEFRLHRQWFDPSAMAELLGVDFAAGEQDRWYRCLDRMGDHQQEWFVYLRPRWEDLFGAQFDMLRYELRSTYFAGEAEETPKAQRGSSRDHRPDCLPVVLALVITAEGLPLAYEVLDGNPSDRTTLRGCLAKIEKTQGQARRVWRMDRGLPSEEVLAEMRAAGDVFDLVGTPRGKIQPYEKKWLALPWQKVRDPVEVKWFAEDGSDTCWPRAQGGRPRRGRAT